MQPRWMTLPSLKAADVRARAYRKSITLRIKQVVTNHLEENVLFRVHAAVATSKNVSRRSNRGDSPLTSVTCAFTWCQERASALPAITWPPSKARAESTHARDVACPDAQIATVSCPLNPFSNLHKHDQLRVN
jgi:hypothetical protein